MALTPSRERRVLGSAKMQPDGQIRLTVRAEREDGTVIGDLDGIFPAAMVVQQGWRIDPFPTKPGDEGTVLAST